MRKYQNEILVLFAVVFLIASVIFEKHEQNRLNTVHNTTENRISKLEDTARLKKLWLGNKTILRRLKLMNNFVGEKKVKHFEHKRDHADIVLDSLSSNELNAVLGKYIASTPMQIETLSVKRNGRKYGLELKCGW